MPAFRMAALGDSFVEGRGDPDLDGPFHGWVPRLADRLGIAHRGVLNLGKHQATTQDVVDGQLPAVLASKPPMIGVIVGVNDLVSDYDPERFRRNLGTIYASLRGVDTTVFTAAYPDIPKNLAVPEVFRNLLRERFTEANSVLREITAATGTLCLDVTAIPEWSEARMWAPDGLHPSVAGHQLFADQLTEFVAGATGLVPPALLVGG
ncbi:SGNH/GDSL hydrolase family protein [Saccharopolyspora indica]|uniref:SGNH/GDSL hydrolase family protein n=1 Tax=Saccharopolyspora indica TaxID=1229659 RepID=UPI0022EAC2F1|nr:SGNH/GDSL hydrolase family protein [Saccharopolyspora indica]MDA3648384.1 SGNH/GDSL hydrolase family protein [Saccharopolyspora indica]